MISKSTDVGGASVSPALPHGFSEYVVICAAQCVANRAYTLWEMLDKDPDHMWANRHEFTRQLKNVLVPFSGIIREWCVYYPDPPSDLHPTERVVSLSIQRTISGEVFVFTIHKNKPRTKIIMSRGCFGGACIGEVNIFAPIFDALSG